MSMHKTFMFLLSDIPKNNIGMPIEKKTLKDPYSPEVQLILNLYSMEPPFYNDLNHASKTSDGNKLTTLGPFAKAMYGILGMG